MALYVIPVPAPAAGHDWSYTIPGQYVEDVVAVSATLLTGGTLVTVPDESGNGRNATVNTLNDYTIGATGPFGGGANNYAISHANASPLFNGEYAAAAVTGLFSGAAFSGDQWVNINNPSSSLGSGLFGWFVNQVAGNRLGVNVALNTNNPYDIRYDWSGSGIFSIVGAASLGAWHHIGVTWDGTRIRTYVDGALVAASVAGVPAGNPTQFSMGGNHSFGELRGKGAAPACYASTLSPGQIAAHAAASGSFSAYKAAVLADSPVGLWNIGKPATGPARNVTLRTTNGTNVVGQYPTGTTPVSGQTGYAYSWASALGSGTQTPGGTTVSVPIPDLILPAGYTIGTFTSDLAGTDQWSNIAIWWDDTVQQQQQGTSDYVYPPGVTYVIRR